MRIRWMAWPLSIGAGVLIYFLITTLNQELAPMEDKGGFRVIATAPEGTTFEVMDEYMMDLLDILDTLPEKRAYIAVTSPGFGATTAANSAFVFMSLVDPK